MPPCLALRKRVKPVFTLLHIWVSEIIILECPFESKRSSHSPPSTEKAVKHYNPLPILLMDLQPEQKKFKAFFRSRRILQQYHQQETIEKESQTNYTFDVIGDLLCLSKSLYWMWHIFFFNFSSQQHNAYILFHLIFF